MEFEEDEMYEVPMLLTVSSYIRTKFKGIIFNRTTDMLYHYTNIAGFQGIVETKGFWISSIRFLNDYKEYDHGIELCTEIIHSLKNEYQQENENRFLDILMKKLVNPINDVFVVSFCEDGDLLGQWRGYGQGEYGISMGFPIRELVNHLFNHGNDRIFAFPVIYEDMSKQLVLREILRIGIESVKRNKYGSVDWILSDIADLILESLYHYIPFFKDKSFADEREWRSVHTNYAKDAKSQYPIHFRPRGSSLLPYIEVQLHQVVEKEDKKTMEPCLPLREVIIGPSSKQDLTHESVKYYLKMKGMNNVSVKDSAIPFRW